MNKFKILISEYKNTRVIKGSKFLYFLVYWLTKALSFLQQRSPLMNSLIHSLVRLFPKPTFVIQNMSGIFIVQAFDDSTTICSDYFEKDLRGWLTNPTVKDIFIDIGANRGIYTIIAPTLFAYKEVHTFEPNPPVYQTLLANIKLNNLETKVRGHEVALGEEISEVNFVYDEMHKGGGKIETNQGKDLLQIKVDTLDNLLPVEKFPRVSFVKIDTEGYEFKVLNGMKKILTSMPQDSYLMIECTQKNDLELFLKNYQFKCLESINHDHLFVKYA